MSGHSDNALRFIINELREFLRGRQSGDFKSETDFAEQVFEHIAKGRKEYWQNKRAVNAINRITKSVYQFYRLKDNSAFDGKSPVKFRFGGADTRSVKFFGELDHFYFSKFADNQRDELKNFLREQYLENGNAIFGRKSTKELDDFRRAAGDKLKNLSDRSVESIIHTSVQRIRIWGHIGSMAQANIKQARIIAILDSRTSEICTELNGKIINIGTAQSAIKRLNKLEPGEFAAEMYESNVGRAISKNPVEFIKGFYETDGETISDDLTKTGRSFPPYHPRCRSRLAAIIKTK